MHFYKKKWILSSSFLKCGLFSGVYSWLGSFREGSNFPQGDDLNGAAQALVRLQDTYRLDMTSLSQGVVKPFQQSVVNSDKISKYTKKCLLFYLVFQLEQE